MIEKKTLKNLQQKTTELAIGFELMLLGHVPAQNEAFCFCKPLFYFWRLPPTPKEIFLGKWRKCLPTTKEGVYMYMLWYCWWKESGVHQLRLVVYLPISLQGLSTIQPVVGLGISEPSTGNNLKIPACRRGLQVGCTQNPSCWWSLFSSQDAW